MHPSSRVTPAENVSENIINTKGQVEEGGTVAPSDEHDGTTETVPAHTSLHLDDGIARISKKRTVSLSSLTSNFKSRATIIVDFFTPDNGSDYRSSLVSVLAVF